MLFGITFPTSFFLISSQPRYVLLLCQKNTYRSLACSLVFFDRCTRSPRLAPPQAAFGPFPASISIRIRGNSFAARVLYHEKSKFAIVFFVLPKISRFAESGGHFAPMATALNISLAAMCVPSGDGWLPSATKTSSPRRYACEKLSPQGASRQPFSRAA